MDARIFEELLALGFRWWCGDRRDEQREQGEKAEKPYPTP
jgi:hypothetical protein